MTQALQAKQGNRESGHAGRILDQLVAAFLTAVARAIRHRRGKHRVKIQNAISAESGPASGALCSLLRAGGARGSSR
jgi:hypothetical protein